MNVIRTVGKLPGGLEDAGLKGGTEELTTPKVSILRQ